jgi:dipeptidyl aminopeptidase/acylaminoacyl peptidase
MEDSDLFAGAISINGVTDWYRLATRIPSTPFAALFNGTPATHNLDQYLNSSIYARVPTDIDRDDKILLFHGDRDTSVPSWQSTEFHEVLEDHDKDSRIVVLEDTGHIPERARTLQTICEAIEDHFSLALSCR